MATRIIIGDVREKLRLLATESVDCIITSPPYWGLRSYLPADHPLKHLEIGQEPSVHDWVRVMVSVFEECRRVLKRTGTLWVNFGDSYVSDGGSARPQSGEQMQGRAIAENVICLANARPARSGGLRPKQLIGQPWRVAFAMQDAGWILRQENIWSKPNPMPESAADRFTNSHEKIFMFAKGNKTILWRARDTREWAWTKPNLSELTAGGKRRWQGFDYFFDQDAVEEAASEGTHARVSQDVLSQEGSARANGGTRSGRAMKAVLRGFDQGLFAHRADACAGSQAARPHPPGVTPKAVAGWQAGPGRHNAAEHNTTARRRGVGFGHGTDAAERQRGRVTTEKDEGRDEQGLRTSSGMGHGPGWRARQNTSFMAATTGIVLTRNKRSVWEIPTHGFKGAHFATFPPALARPCILAGCPIGGTVLDIFAGAGTVALEAERHHRNAILIELFEDSAELTRERLHADAPLLADITIEAA